MNKIFTFFILIIFFILTFLTSSFSEWESVYEAYNRRYSKASKLDSNKVACLANIIWKQAYRVYITADGGGTWAQILQEEIYYLNPEVRDSVIIPLCLSYYKENNIVVGCKDGWIFKTTDNGETWKRYNLPRGYVDNPEKIRINSIFINDDNTGFAVTALRVYSTNDGGCTWKRQKVGFPDGFIAGIFWAADSHSSGNIMVYLLARTYDTYLLKSDDYGITWEQIEMPYRSSTNCVYFLNKDLGWICQNNRVDNETIDNVVIRTTNGGYNWETIYRGDILGGKTFFSHHFLDSLQGIAVGTYRSLIMTTDGGFTWHEENCTPGDQRHFNVFDCVYLTNESALIFTDNTKIYKWTKGTTPVDNPFSVKEIILHPNPATNHITITLDEFYTSKPEIDIIDMLGFSIQAKHNISDREITINTSLLNPGVYFLLIHSGDKTDTRKFIVVR